MWHGYGNDHESLVSTVNACANFSICMLHEWQRLLVSGNIIILCLTRQHDLRQTYLTHTQERWVREMRNVWRTNNSAPNNHQTYHANNSSPAVVWRWNLHQMKEHPLLILVVVLFFNYLSYKFLVVWLATSNNGTIPTVDHQYYYRPYNICISRPITDQSNTLCTASLHCKLITL